MFAFSSLHLAFPIFKNVSDSLLEVFFYQTQIMGNLETVSIDWLFISEYD